MTRYAQSGDHKYSHVKAGAGSSDGLVSNRSNAPAEGRSEIKVSFELNLRFLPSFEIKSNALQRSLLMTLFAETLKGFLYRWKALTSPILLLAPEWRRLAHRLLITKNLRVYVRGNNYYYYYYFGLAQIFYIGDNHVRGAIEY